MLTSFKCCTCCKWKRSISSLNFCLPVCLLSFVQRKISPRPESELCSLLAPQQARRNYIVKTFKFFCNGENPKRRKSWNCCGAKSFLVKFCLFLAENSMTRKLISSEISRKYQLGIWSRGRKVGRGKKDSQKIFQSD